MLESYVDNDLVSFIKEVNYDFLFLVNPGDDIVVDKLSNIEKVSVKVGTEAGELVNLVRSSRYLLCRKFPYQKKDRFSGALSLGMSCGVPMIVQRKHWHEKYQAEFDHAGYAFEWVKT